MLNITPKVVAAAFFLAMLSGCADDAATEVSAGQVAEPAPPAAEGEEGATEPATQPDGPPSSTEEVVAMIDRAAEDLGEPDPTDIEWVRTSRSAANTLISESVVGAGQPDVDVLVVQAQGDFMVEGSSGPPDEETGRATPDPTGTVLSVVLDAASGELLDFGVTHAPADLAELGEVTRAG